MTVYDSKPRRFLERLSFFDGSNPAAAICCAGFELKKWRCEAFADHLIEWLPEYALPEDELSVTHANIYVTLKKAAIRIYTSPHYTQRGEAGEIALHAICRDYFDTIPISNRVFYKSTSNDVIKAFDMVHARIPRDGNIELWLGESKLYTSAEQAISDAIRSVEQHLEQGFLNQQKLILGPQIPKTTPRYEEIMNLFESQTSLDKLLESGIFVIGIHSNSASCKKSESITSTYKTSLLSELSYITERLAKSKLPDKIRILLIYVPLNDKKQLLQSFDKKLKGLQ